MSGLLGILGGTFDPVHVAHLRLAEEALEHLRLSSIRWIPSGQPGHRGAPAASAEHRIAMLRLALAGHPGFVIDEADARASAPTWTVVTLERLRAELGARVPLALIIGADQLHALDAWRDWRRLFALAHLAVAERPGYRALDALPDAVAQEVARRRAASAALAGSPAGAIAVFSMTALDVSASAVRAALAAGSSARYLVPDAVLDYIAAHHLYPPADGRSR